MTIEFACRCGKTLRVKDEHAGRRFKCPGCGIAVQAPAAANVKKSELSSLQPLAQNNLEDWFSEELSRPTRLTTDRVCVRDRNDASRRAIGCRRWGVSF